jgi:elongator complex protein 3
MRVNRDIPSTVISDGVMSTNLRQLVDGKNKVCRCIRCREPMNRKINFKAVKLKKFYYDSSGGKEVFISIEDIKNDILLGFCRLRKPYKPFRPEITDKSSGVRELHVYGMAAALNKRGLIQHKGYGKRLMKEAEKIAKMEWGCNKMIVISSIGVKEYYRKLGYKNDGVYMSKKL